MQVFDGDVQSKKKNWNKAWKVQMKKKKQKKKSL